MAKKLIKTETWLKIKNDLAGWYIERTHPDGWAWKNQSVYTEDAQNKFDQASSDIDMILSNYFIKLEEVARQHKNAHANGLMNAEKSAAFLKEEFIDPDDYFGELDALRESGEINMFGAPRWLVENLDGDITYPQAQAVFAIWANQFGGQA